MVGISNSSTPNNGTPTPFPDTPTTPSIIEHMMAMVRTQILVHRQPIQFASTTVKMTRLLVEFNGVGIRVENSNPTGTNGSYSITSVGGSSASPSKLWHWRDYNGWGPGPSRMEAMDSLDYRKMEPYCLRILVAANGGDALRTISAMLSARDRWLFIANW